jgi:hypothetical protein
VATSDGGVWAIDALFCSMGDTPINAPVVGIAASQNGFGHEMVASDGGILTFGDAHLSGSALLVDDQARWEFRDCTDVG